MVYGFDDDKKKVEIYSKLAIDDQLSGISESLDDKADKDYVEHNFSGELAMQVVDITVSVTGSSEKHSTLDFTNSVRSGYQPIGVIGWDIIGEGTTYLNLYELYYTLNSSDPQNLRHNLNWGVRNNGSSDVSDTLRVYVLLFKIDFS